MNVTGGLPGAFEPATWFLAFFETSSTPWLDRVLPGRFKHVSAFAYVPGACIWVWCDAHWKGLSIVFLPHQGFILQIAPLTRNATIVKTEKRPLGAMPVSTRFGFYCVPFVKQLIGLRSFALTPDQCYRFIIRTGGAEIANERAQATGRPDAPLGEREGAD